MPSRTVTKLAIAGLVLASAPAAFAHSAQFGDKSPSSTQTAVMDIAKFAPAGARIEHRVDYQHWDEALKFLVIPMGPSVREGAPRVQSGTGTRRIYGHDSRYRLEGNRAAFSFLTDKIRSSLSAYRADLENVGSRLDLPRMPRNEQLAFWLNLHNVAVIEALAKEYPLASPGARAFGSNRAPLDDAKLVTVKGVALSPRDIREGIVYPNWRDPKVMYGFWRGDIGSPSIQRVAYKADNLDALLALSAEEFINSLRGVEKYGGALRVSQIYKEAAPYYFSDFGTLRAHLGQYAGDDVKRLLADTSKTAYSRYETDLADLSRGEREPIYSSVGAIDSLARADLELPFGGINAAAQRTKINPAIRRLMVERRLKLHKAQKRGLRTGRVIFGEEGYDASKPAPEVE